MAKIIVVLIVLSLILAIYAEVDPENNLNITTTAISDAVLFKYFDIVYNKKLLTPFNDEITPEALVFQLGNHVEGE